MRKTASDVGDVKERVLQTSAQSVRDACFTAITHTGIAAPKPPEDGKAGPWCGWVRTKLPELVTHPAVLLNPQHLYFARA